MGAKSENVQEKLLNSAYVRGYKIGKIKWGESLSLVNKWACVGPHLKERENIPKKAKVGASNIQCTWGVFFKLSKVPH